MAELSPYEKLMAVKAPGFDVSQGGLPTFLTPSEDALVRARRCC
jgi:hypothetical protein